MSLARNVGSARHNEESARVQKDAKARLEMVLADGDGGGSPAREAQL